MANRRRRGVAMAGKWRLKSASAVSINMMTVIGEYDQKK